MAGQNVERREVLRVLSLAAAAGQFVGFERWAFACPQHPETGIVRPPGNGNFQPQFFQPEEYACIQVLCDLIIPSDESPGAKDAGVSEFVDFMAWSDRDLQYAFRFGLAWLDGHCRYLFQRPFVDLTRAQQTETLEHLAYGANHRPGEQDGREFFHLIREYTVMGFYTSRIGMQELDSPALQLHYDTPPNECPTGWSPRV